MEVIFVTAFPSLDGGFSVRNDETGEVLGEVNSLANVNKLVEVITGDSAVEVVIELANGQ